ncbi:MAG: hypothetical protein KDB53_13620 [Planctomycetes bacterium]|nr:hypothetical protein [Planctomycetota bacterium]
MGPRLALLVAVVALAAATGLPAQQVWNTVKEWDSGPENNRLDIVILGDGYTASEIPLFRTHVTNFINHYLQTSPFDRYQNSINIWRVEVESAQSGADHPMPCFTPEVLVNTALNSKYCTGGTNRCLTADTALAQSTALLNVPAYDEILVLVNDGTYGGCAGSISTSTAVHASANEVMTHELGHSIFSLADEYWTAGATYSGNEPTQVNATTHDAAGIVGNQTKWHYWMGIESISAHEGCRYYEFGLYRPRTNCKMRSLGQPLCAVCREKITKDLRESSDAFDAVSPTTSAVQVASTTLTATIPALDIGALVADWTIDGQSVGAGVITTLNGQTTYSLLPSAHLAGSFASHVVSLTLSDPTTFYRLQMPWQPFPVLSWTVNGSDADFAVTAMSLESVPGLPGELFHVNDTVTNLGTTSGPPVHVGYYLSSDATITTSDILVGERVLPSLAAGATLSLRTGCRLPLQNVFPGQQFWVGVFVNDQSEFFEPNLLDNRMVATGLVSPTNATVLSPSPVFMNLTATQTLTIPIDFGPAEGNRVYRLFPSVTAPGTGTPFGPYVGVAPFRFDEVSVIVGTGIIGWPWFQNFSGVLDANGQATALFVKPALPPGVGSTIIWFFAHTLDLDGNGQEVVPRFSEVPFVFVF